MALFSLFGGENSGLMKMLFSQIGQDLYSTAFKRMRQEDFNFSASLGYTANSRLVWGMVGPELYTTKISQVIDVNNRLLF